MTATHPSQGARDDLIQLDRICDRVRWLSSAIVDAANRGRPNETGVKVGGHQASSASMVEIMVSLWFAELTSLDRVSVKPHAAPVLHAINYLLGGLNETYLTRLRERGGLQSYPSRRKDPGTIDFSTGSVGIGATATAWAAMSHRYAASRFPQTPAAGRFISLVGDAELDEGAVWEAVADPAVARLGELLWVVDLNRQSLDRVVPDIQVDRITGMFAAAGWQVLVVKWGRRISEVFERENGDVLRRRLESMPNEEYQRMLRAPAAEIHDRLCPGIGPDVGPDIDPDATALRSLLHDIDPDELSILIRDLGGHDVGLLLDTYRQVSNEQPTVVLAYTIKGNGLPTEGHPSNHSALLTERQMELLALRTGTDPADPWARFDPQTAASTLCAHRSEALRRPQTPQVELVDAPVELPRSHRAPISTQAALGRLLTDLAREAPDLASRIVTCSPDVASSTNLGGWINKTGVWSVNDRTDWFADDSERLLRWAERTTGQHIELGIAEVNLVGLLGELGTTWSRWGQRLIPIATLYDPFLARALEPWSYGIYSGGQSIIVGTPSGVTLAAEGGAHQSITTPAIGLQQPECTAWEPAFAQDLEWCLLAAMNGVGRPGGESSYFRLSTRPLDPRLAAVPEDPMRRERRRRQCVAGGYRISAHAADADDVLLVGVGAIMPEVLQAAEELADLGVTSGVVCLTSPDLVFRSFQARGDVNGAAGDIASIIFPESSTAPIVSVMDGHPHTLAFLGAVRSSRIRCLGVTEFGQSSSLSDAYEIHGIDVAAIIDAAMTVIGR